MMISTSLVIMFALSSALSRGFITIIDRYQMGYRKGSVTTVNFFNNLLSMLLVTVLFAYLIIHFGLGLTLTFSLLVRLILYAALVQAVANGYSLIFKQVTIMESVVISKATDFFIPLALFTTTLYFNWQTYLVAVISTFVIIGLFLSDQHDSHLNKETLLKNFLIIGPLLVVQAAISPLIVQDIRSPYSLIMFTMITIYFRFLFTLMSFIRQTKKTVQFEFHLTPIVLLLYSSRAILTLLAQISFTLATSSKSSGVAWIFLNMTSLFSVVLASFILKEKTRIREITALVLIILVTFIINKV